MRKGWELKKLGDLCLKITDGSHNPPKGVELSDYLMLSSRDIFDEQIHYDNPRYLSKIDFENEDKRTAIKAKDVLLTIVGTIGRVAVVPDKFPNFTLQRSVAVLRPNENKIDSYFLKYSLQNSLTFLISESRGAAQKGIYLNQLKQINLTLPSLSEQQEIVSILDDAFESIERTKSNAEQNLKNARELFDSYLQNIFEKGNWIETTLEKLSNKKDAVVSGPFGSNLKVSDYKEKGVPILRLQNIGKGFFINKSIKFITKEKAEELKYHSFKSGDIVLAKLGIPIGKTCIIPESYEDGIITADVVRIRPDKNIVNYKFLEYFLNTNISVAQLTGNISGATRPRVNLSDVRNIKLTLPKLQEQKDIVDELDNLTMKINKLEEILNRKINSLEELKKSILQKAFNGELKTSKISA
jgi:type I restriction enzyme S subunit